MYKLLATTIVSAFALVQVPAFAQDKPAPKAEEKKADAKKDAKAPEAKKDDTKSAEAMKDEQKKPKKGGC
ncbi:MAG TPA: hypothetical protein VMK32_06660 [Burkholderiaceae bacterium]|nr:hypothetical protein [Burkholderiaceae bacterium]